ncbi:MAG: cation diffusion facilitator family transporter [Thiobacillus sp.]
MSKIKLGLNGRFKLGFVVNTCFMLFELIVGTLTGSLVLIADGIHNLTDSITLVISWIANWIGKKPADKTHTLGHGRITVVAAFVNSTILVATGIVIVFEAYRRFTNPIDIAGDIIVVTALIGIFANGFVAWLFRNFRSDINVKAAFLNMTFDMLFSIASMVAGALIIVTGQNWIDPAVSLGVSFGLFYAAFGIFKQASNIFLEGVPHDVDIKEIRLKIRSHPGVEKIHNLYAWGIDSTDYAICCSLVPSNKSQKNIEKTREELKIILQGEGFKLVIIEII